MTRVRDEARRRRLEAELQADPDDPDRYLVYADWLQERGDPRGLLVAIRRRIATASSDAERFDAQAAEAELFAAHGAELRGPLDAYPRGAIAWHLGVPTRIGIADTAEIRKILAHPVGRVVRELVVGAAGARDLDELVEILRPNAPCLQRVIVPGHLQLPKLGSSRIRIENTVTPGFDVDWIQASNRTPPELWSAALRWGVGLEPENHRRSRGNWAPFVERYFFELLCIGTDDAWIARAILMVYATIQQGSLLPSKSWLATAAALRPYASARLAIELWRYVAYHLETSYQRLMIRDYQGLFWPLAALWHPVLEPKLVAYFAGGLDRKRATPDIRTRRIKLLGWLCEQVSAPALQAALGSDG